MSSKSFDRLWLATYFTNSRCIKTEFFSGKYLETCIKIGSEYQQPRGFGLEKISDGFEPAWTIAQRKLFLWYRMFNIWVKFHDLIPKLNLRGVWNMCKVYCFNTKMHSLCFFCPITAGPNRFFIVHWCMLKLKRKLININD